MCQRAVARSIRPSMRLAFLLATGGGDWSGHAVGNGIAPRRRSGLHDLAGQCAADDLLHAAAGGEQPVEIDAGGDAHRVQAVHEVLAADIAGGAGSEGTATEAADGGVEVR